MPSVAPTFSISDFAPAGPLRATADGLRVVQSDDFTLDVHYVYTRLEREFPNWHRKDRVYALVTYVAAKVCDHHTLDDELSDFALKNWAPLCRLLYPIIVKRYPMAAAKGSGM